MSDIQERVFERLFKAAELAKFAPIERRAYEDSLKYYRDLKNVVDTAKGEGVEEGIQKGIQKGIEKGIEKGRNIEIARTLKKNGISPELIEKSTGLSLEEIENL